MRKYTQLTSEQRYQIYGLKKSGWKQVQIVAEIGVHPSTISKELRRNRGERGWRPAQAQRMRDARRQGAVNGKRFSLNDWVEVARLIPQDFSPEQVAERIELEGGFQISHETIYQRIYKDKERGGDLWRHLRCQKPHRKRYASGQERRGAIKNRISIDDRPEIVAQRVRMGDWEGDTVIGKSHQGGAGDAGGAKITLCSGGSITQQTCRRRNGEDQ